MAEHQRDAGLVRAVGPWDLAASAINCVIGTSIFVLPAALAGYVGAFAPLAFLVGAVALGAVAICFAEAGSRVSTSGGTYGYVEAAFGPLPAYITGNLQWLADLLACGGVSAALADMFMKFVPPSFTAPARVGIIVGLIASLALLNIGGIAGAARFVNAATLLKLLPILVFIVVGVSAVHAANFTGEAIPGVKASGRALILILFALSGIETSLNASGEVVNPARTVPRALAIATFAVVLLYVSVQAAAQGVLGSSLAHSNAPLADAMAQISPALRLLIMVGAAVSGFAFLGSNILASPRMLFALARDGLLPRILGRVHARNHTPHVAILVYSAVAAGLALTGTYVELAVLSALATVPVYIVGCSAALRLAQRRVMLSGEPLNFPWLTTAAIIGIASMLALIALASRAEIAGLTAMIGASAVVYVLQTRMLRGQIQ